jgi:putrescine transport system ATP-binding protein
MGEGTAQRFVSIERVTKRFGEFTAVADINLAIERGELFALLGGSGCGKTTLLRMLAGFEQPTSGRILIDGDDMAGVLPYERPVNMMFQSYALFPHMTVEQNIGYGLKHEPMTAAQRRARVAEMLDLVQLEGYDRRKPHQLSGGQRQRVALARALAKQPKILLLDEPLGALDKKLREATQFELMNIQHKLGITFIVVTHDQEEAMILASRIAVMDRGKIRQIGTPTNVYEFPRSRFVADFIGSINQFEGMIEDVERDLAVIDAPETGGRIIAQCVDGVAKGSAVAVAVRPEKIQIERMRPATSVNAFRGKVLDLGYFGKDSLYRVQLDSGAILKVNRVNDRRAGESERVAWEDEVWLSFEPQSAIVLTE